MAQLTTPVHIGMVDRSGEQTGTMLHFPLVEEGADLDAIITPTTGAYDIVKVPLILLTKLNLTKTLASIEIDSSAGTLPSAADAQREWATRFTYMDTTTNKKYSFTVPAPVDAIVQAGTDQVDQGDLLVAAFITAFEAQCVSPDGNAVEVLDVRIIGRNS